jgi:hypothetical protein
LTRSSYVVPNIKNPNTKAMFTTFCKIYTRVVKDPNDHRDFYKFFNIISEKPKGFDFSVSEFNKTLEEKYMNIFDLAGEYNDLRCMADIINFIDEKS